jgi:uncharacterized protein YkwD
MHLMRFAGGKPRRPLSNDALDHLGGRRMGKAQRAQYGAVKRADEERSFLGDDKKVQATHQRYLAEINKQRQSVGLPPIK